MYTSFHMSGTHMHALRHDIVQMTCEECYLSVAINTDVARLSSGAKDIDNTRAL